MSQYSTGTASVTNGSATVTGSGTLWLANVTAGDSFTVAGDGVMYDVASVDSDTQVTLSVPYAGTTASGVVYAIGTSFTVPDNFPEMSQGDIETATIFTRAMRKIQGKFSSILAGGANANFIAMPQVGGDPIVESGSNADGEWTKWSDGTIAQWYLSSTSYTTVSAKAGGFFNNGEAFTFPTAFNNSVSVSVTAVIGQGPGNVAIAGYVFAFSLTGVSVGASAFTNTDTFKPGFYAIGRWK